MELFTLDGAFQPYDLVENYQSLIWTERYSTNGDFQVVFNDIATGIRLLPLESYVTLRNSTVPMIVEVHKIEKKKNAAPTLTVTGRSFESVLERRASVKNLPMSTARPSWTISAISWSDAAFIMLRTVLGDVDQRVGGYLVLPARTPNIDTTDAIPEISLTMPADYVIPGWDADFTYKGGDVVQYFYDIWKSTANGNIGHAPGVTYWTMVTSGTTLTPTALPANVYTVEAKDLYSATLDMLANNHHGLKAVRPVPGGTKVGIEIYNGADLTQSVVFDAKFDQIDDATYLLSKAGSANVAYYYGAGGSNVVLKNIADANAAAWSASTTYQLNSIVNYKNVTYISIAGSNLNFKPSDNTDKWKPYQSLSGLAKRVLLVEDTAEDSSDADVRRSRGLIELYKNNATALFDGSVAEQVAAMYNHADGYTLGDIVKLQGDYGISENVRVAEFIRSSDASGEKAYPAFESVAD